MAHPTLLPLPRRGARSLAVGLALALALALASSLGAAAPLAAQQPAAALTEENRGRGLEMLVQVRKDLRERYYDSTFKGVDMEAKYAEAEAGIRAARNNNEMIASIAQYVSELNDSHTWFIPPAHVAQVDYGFATRFVGDTCFVVEVRKGSDAEKKGLKVGDAVLRWDTFKPHRKTYYTLMYLYGTLNPRPGIKLVAQSPGGSPRDVLAMAKITQGERVADYTDINRVSRVFQSWEDAEFDVNHRVKSFGDSVMVWKMYSFLGGDDANIDEMVKRAKKHRAVVLDLRNNGGGSVATELYLIGKFFDREIPVATLAARGRRTLRKAPSTDREPYRGMLVVLQNSESASASEVTARVLQLEARAIVVGDRSAGMVVTSTTQRRSVGHTKVLDYGVQVSVLDVIMPDGNRLEGVGVEPDHLVLPTGADIAAGRDPQLAKALELVRMRMTPEEAGQVWGKKKK